MKEIRLWKNRHELSDKVTIVDDEDYEKVIEAITSYKKDGTPKKNTGRVYLWTSTSGKNYAACNKKKYRHIHRIIMNNPSGLDIDHINGDTLDNRKENLRICTRAQNAQNRPLRKDSASGYKGVYEVKKPQRRKYIKKSGEVTYREHMPKKRFYAYIGNPEATTKTPRNIKLGYFHTAEEAAECYDRKAIEMYGEFARVNFPEKMNEYLRATNKKTIENGQGTINKTDD